jgi:NhaA family Na+:H+ antiporter
MAQAQGKVAWWQRDTTPGYLLLAAAAASFLLQNGPTGEGFRTLLASQITLVPGVETLTMTVQDFVKNALMALFFLFVGLELKREFMIGPLSNPREAALPFFGAVGGLLMPAAIFLLMVSLLAPDQSEELSRGWAIPAATDIAFAIGVLSLLGSRVPPGLRLFLLALAVIDDVAAILIIAVFYSSDVDLISLAAAGGLLALAFGINIAGVRRLSVYWVIGVLLWLAMAQSGVSATLAGVMLALAIPLRGPNDRSPLMAAEHALKPWVQLGIMPLFALVMAGVAVGDAGVAALTHPLTIAIATALVVGKPLGIVISTTIAAALLRQPLPGRPVELLGVGCVAGIGFTMSLFIGSLAFIGNEALQAPLRFGVLGGSMISAVLGLTILALVLKRPKGEVSSPDLARREDQAEDAGVLQRMD